MHLMMNTSFSQILLDFSNLPQDFIQLCVFMPHIRVSKEAAEMFCLSAICAAEGQLNWEYL